MAQAGSLQRSRPPARPGVWYVPPALAAVCAVVAAFLAPAGARAPVAGCGAVAALGVAAVAGETARRGRAIAQLEQRLRYCLAQTDRLATDVLPRTLDKVGRATVAREVMPEAPAPEATPFPEFAALQRKLLHSVVDAAQEREYQRDSAKRAIANIACRIQTEVHRLQDDVSRMQFRHGGPEVLGDLMHLEHGINVTGRVATALAVLGGGRPVRQWQRPISLYDVLRAGSGPIAEYLRVEQHQVIDIAVTGPAVEPLIMVLAELLDNATRYSPPSSTVVMFTEEVASGVEISVEDKGTGLTRESRRRAEFLLTQAADGLDLEDLGETARIGLRVAGILASRLGLRISLRPSTCHGVRAVVFIPQELLTQTPLPSYVEEIPYRDPAPSTPAVLNGQDVIEYERDANGLPQRRRPVRGTTPRVTPPSRPRPGAQGRRARHRTTGDWVGDFFDPPAEGDRDGDGDGNEDGNGNDGSPPAAGRPENTQGPGNQGK